jgi:hypothetical protein
MRKRSVLKRFMLLIVVLLHHEDQLAAGNEETCKLKMNHDAYILRNDLFCQDDALDNNFSFIQRYKSTRSCIPDFDVTGISFLTFILTRQVTIQVLFFQNEQSLFINRIPILLIEHN